MIFGRLSHKNERQACVGYHRSEGVRCCFQRVLLEEDEPAGFQVVRNVAEELAMNLPIGIMIALLTDARLGEMWRIAYDEIPLLGFRKSLQIVRKINRRTSFQPVPCNGPPTRGYGFWVNVREAERFGKIMCQQRKADEARSRAPFECAFHLGHSSCLQQRDNVLAES